MSGLIDVGSGPALVLIPGLQGRWEWMQPAVEALSKRFRVISYSLCDEPSSGFACDQANGFDAYVAQVGEALDRSGLDTAIVAGVSYGGLIAAEFAARHPARVSALVLVSPLPTDWAPDARARFYLKSPRLLSPLFFATASGRNGPEVAAAFPGIGERWRFVARHGLRLARAPISPGLMARRVQWVMDHAFADPRDVTAPALVLTGEPGLDRVVPVEISRRYLDQLRFAQHVVLPHTGHLGTVTRPDAFTELLGRFVDADRIPA